MTFLHPLLETTSLTNILGWLLGIIVTFLIVGAVRRVYFHPLSKYPGPKLLAITNLIHIRYVLRGEWVHKVLQWHEQYGPVVRVAPNEVSYITEAAFTDIYKSRQPHQMKKFMPWTPKDWQHALFDCPSDEEHSMLRKRLSPVMSDRGVREREPILLHHIARMVQQLKHAIRRSGPPIFELTGWYQCVSGDIMGDLLSGEVFGGLDNSRPHPMLAANHEQLKGLAIGTAFNRNPITQTIFVKLLGPAQKKSTFVRIGSDRFDQRLYSRDTKSSPPSDQPPDILSILQEDLDTPNHPTTAVARHIAADFVLAGTDTVAIVLAGATYLLLSNLSTYTRLRNEVRSTFSSPSDITLAAVNGLKYQNAVINETLRLWPPGTETQRRIVPPGGKVINGEFVPAGTLVGVYLWAAGRYSKVWKDVEQFVPERWLGGSTSSSLDDDADNSFEDSEKKEKTEINKDEKKHQQNKTTASEYDSDHKSLLQPYLLGPRNCVGQQLANAQIRLILATMIWHFDMELENPNETDWMDVPIFGIVADKKPLRVKVTERR